MHKQLSEADSLPHNVPLYVLHSSVDIEDCMAALHGEDGAASCSSSVAESSITIKTLRPPQDRHTESAATPSDANGPCFFYRRGCCSVEPCPFGPNPLASPAVPAIYAI